MEITRLLEHRKSFQENEFRGALLNIDELTHDEQRVVNDDFMLSAKSHNIVDLPQMWALYVAVLHSWGIMCPHHQGFRFYEDGSQSLMPLTFSQSRWYTCALCGATVINR